MRNNLKSWIRALAIAIVAGPVLSFASNLAIPNSFSSGTLIQSAQVNANFAAVQTAVNSKQDAITGTCSAGQAMTGVGAGGVPTCASVGLAFGDSVTGSAATSGVTVTNSGAGAGIEGDNSSTNGSAYGVLGQITSTSPGGFSTGVKGENDSSTGLGIGVWGDTKGSGWGVYGTAAMENGVGVLGSSVAGDGVEGESQSASSAGVNASNANATGPGLNISQGYLKVQGAGAGTTTTAFTWTATSANTAGDNTVITNPMTDGNANLLLFVTQNWEPNSVYNPHPVGVYYTGTHWAIFNEDSTTMPTNATFNVLVISP